MGTGVIVANIATLSPLCGPGAGGTRWKRAKKIISRGIQGRDREKCNVLSLWDRWLAHRKRVRKLNRQARLRSETTLAGAAVGSRVCETCCALSIQGSLSPPLASRILRRSLRPRHPAERGISLVLRVCLPNLSRGHTTHRVPKCQSELASRLQNFPWRTLNQPCPGGAVSDTGRWTELREMLPPFHPTLSWWAGSWQLL